MAARVAVQLVTGDFETLEPVLDDSFRMMMPNASEVVTKPLLERRLNALKAVKNPIVSFEVLTAFSHGKYAAVSTRADASDGYSYYSHDLYEFTSAGPKAKLQSITSYIVDTQSPSVI